MFPMLESTLNSFASPKSEILGFVQQDVASLKVPVDDVKDRKRRSEGVNGSQ
jgi:hypothetical protein